MMDSPFLPDYTVLVIIALPLYFLAQASSAGIKECDENAFVQTEAWQNEAISLGIYDPKGRRIRIGFNDDRSLSFSSNATAEVTALVNRIAITDIGLNTLKLIDATQTKIYLEINKVKIISGTDGSNTAAETYPVISTPVNKRGKPVGTRYISKARIILYEATVRDMVAKNKGKVLINGIVIDTKHFSVADIVSSYLMHEFIHVLDLKSSGALNPMAAKAQIEKKPYASQLQYLKELDDKKQ